MQALKPLRVAFGADGEPMTLLFASISCICSELTSPAPPPFVVADVNAGSVRLGNAAIQSPEMALNCLPPSSSDPWL